MQYIRFTGGNNCTGTEFEMVRIFDEDTQDSELDEYAEEAMNEHAEEHEYLMTGWDNDFESESEKEAYYGDSWCTWEEIPEDEYEEEYK